MTTTDLTGGLLARIAELRHRCPEMRFGQMLATVGLLAEDETGHSLWDVEDGELAAALERFAGDLARSRRDRAEQVRPAEPAVGSLTNTECFPPSQ